MFLPEGSSLAPGKEGAPDVFERHMEEWGKVRDAFSGFDERLHDLRKFGFSFLTALLAAETIFIPGTAGSPGVPGFTKLSLFGVTLLLIVAVRFIERNYQLVLQGLAIRGKILERELDLELTETISIRHRIQHSAWYESGLYVALSLGSLGLGGAILYPDLQLIGVLLALWAITVTVLVFIALRELHMPYGWVDWTVVPLEVTVGEPVRITLTNLDREERYELAPGTVWKVASQEGTEVHSEAIQAPIRLSPDDTHIWTWDTSDVPPGIYRVFPVSYRYEERFLREPVKVGPTFDRSLYRKVIVTAPPPKPAGFPFPFPFPAWPQIPQE